MAKDENGFDPDDLDEDGERIIAAFAMRACGRDIEGEEDAQCMRPDGHNFLSDDEADQPCSTTYDAGEWAPYLLAEIVRMEMTMESQLGVSWSRGAGASVLASAAEHGLIVPGVGGMPPPPMNRAERRARRRR